MTQMQFSFGRKSRGDSTCYDVHVATQTLEHQSMQTTHPSDSARPHVSLYRPQSLCIQSSSTHPSKSEVFNQRPEGQIWPAKAKQLARRAAPKRWRFFFKIHFSVYIQTYLDLLLMKYQFLSKIQLNHARRSVITLTIVFVVKTHPIKDNRKKFARCEKPTTCEKQCCHHKRSMVATDSRFLQSTTLLSVVLLSLCIISHNLLQQLKNKNATFNIDIILILYNKSQFIIVAQKQKCHF